MSRFLSTRRLDTPSNEVEAIYEFRLTYHPVFAILSPTGNCQLYCIKYARRILNNSYAKDGENEYDVKLEMFREIHKYMEKKPLMLIDIKQILIETAEKVFGKMIEHRMPYLSTSGSNMVTMIINWNKEK